MSKILEKLTNFVRLRYPKYQFASLVRSGKIVVGKGTYGSPALIDYTNRLFPALVIGNYCSIATEVSFLVEPNHRIDTVATFPILERLGPESSLSSNIQVGPARVGHDVWIGYRCTIVGGCSIGNGAVIASGSVVTRDVRPYTVVGGVPAKEIKRRFSDAICEELESIKWWELTESEVCKLAPFLSDVPKPELRQAVESLRADF
jgi:acetyltransferase-like isoleucine patch superfamily enzyme